MNRWFIPIILLIVSLLTFSLYARAQDVTDPSDAAPPVAQSYTQPQLDQMLAPIALYPDQLLGDILMASTYPLEVVEAARWRQQPGNASLNGESLESTLDQQPWDPSVKSIVAFPQVLHMLDANIQWTEQLGDAFLANQPVVMDSVQRLRQQAQTAGSLTPTPQQAVTTQGSTIIIEPAESNVVYVPAYNPSVAYGNWPYADYPPYSFYPSNYAWGAGLLGFGAGIIISDWFWGWHRWDWRNHRIDIDDGRFRQLNRGIAPSSGAYWRHDPLHRGGVPYRDTATRARFQPAAGPDARRSMRGFAPAAQAVRPSAVNIHPAIETLQSSQNIHPAVQQRPTAIPANVNNARFQPRAAAPAVQRPTTPMYDSFSRGPEVRAQSARGSASRASAPPQHTAQHNNGGNRSGGESHENGIRR